MIHEEICTYEVCKLAKEKGFDWICQDYYNMNSELIIHKIYVINYINSQIEEGCITAPTQSLLQRWLREEKGVTICVDIFDAGWFFDISTFYKQDTGVYEVYVPYKSINVSPVYDTYELALEDALKYALENLV